MKRYDSRSSATRMAVARSVDNLARHAAEQRGDCVACEGAGCRSCQWTGRAGDEHPAGYWVDVSTGHRYTVTRTTERVTLRRDDT